MKKNVIVSLADANYFPLLNELIDSIKQFQQSENVAICILDAGLEPKQKEELINGAWVSNTNNSYPEQLITDYVDDLIFIVKDINGQAIDPPPQNDAGNANRLRVDDVRAVEIALTTRSRKNFYKNTTTNDGNNRTVFDIDSDDETIIDDLFLRETVVLSVNTRNIGLE